MEDWRISVRIEADIHWLEPPANTAQDIMRQQAKVRLNYLASRYEREIRDRLQNEVRLQEQRQDAGRGE